jgi:hypothetical protein
MSDAQPDPMTGENAGNKPGTTEQSDQGYGAGGDVKDDVREPVAPREHLAREN